jgi:Family of unknown function (DUF6081)
VTISQLAAAPYRLVWDDFTDGFAVSGPRARWSYVTLGPYVANDGAITTSATGLRVVSSGAHPQTGDPAFVRTRAPSNPAGPPGTVDHVKWLTLSTHVAATGQPGFDAVPGQVLTLEITASGRTYGTTQHPFDQHVTDPEGDPRLAAAGVNMTDEETGLNFCFFLTNKQIYVYYARRGTAREQFGNYAAFGYAIPVARRTSADWHDLAIRYDRAAGIANWFVDGSEAFRVDRIGGYLASREYLVIDHGGADSPVLPAQLNCGMGMYTLLDASRPGTGGSGLVRIDATESYYFDPGCGQPHRQCFADEESLAANRLFGQGAELLVSHVTVSSAPIRSGGGLDD